MMRIIIQTNNYPKWSGTGTVINIDYSTVRYLYGTVTHTLFGIYFLSLSWNLMDEFSILNVRTIWYFELYGTVLALSERVINLRTLTRLNPTYVLIPVPVICWKYGHKAVNSWENAKNKKKMIEDIALGCWLENDVDPNNETDKEEVVDPNESNAYHTCKM